MDEKTIEAKLIMNRIEKEAALWKVADSAHTWAAHSWSMAILFAAAVAILVLVNLSRENFQAITAVLLLNVAALTMQQRRTNAIVELIRMKLGKET